VAPEGLVSRIPLDQLPGMGKLPLNLSSLCFLRLSYTDLIHCREDKNERKSDKQKSKKLSQTGETPRLGSAQPTYQDKNRLQMV